LQHASHFLAVVIVHLAAKSFQEERFACRNRTIARQSRASQPAQWQRKHSNRSGLASQRLIRGWRTHAVARQRIDPDVKRFSHGSI
jgi:hypothetical protein